MVDVAALLADPALALRAVHLPRPDAEVRWVATSELADPAPFLEGGELLLTTGLATRGWRTQWTPYVERLAAAGVSALAVGVGLTHRQVPVALVRACERHDLNLLEVPRETTFVAVSRAAVRLLHQRDDDAARRTLETQRQLTAAATGDDARRAVTTRLARLVDGVVLVLAPDGRVEEGPSGPRPHLADLDEARVELARIRAQGLTATSTTGDGARTTLVVPVGLRGRPSCYLVVTVPGRMSDPRRSAVTTAVALLGLTAEQERERLETRRRLWHQLHDLLARGEVGAAGVVGEATGAPELPARVQAVHATGSVESLGESLSDALAELERAGVLACLDDGVLRAVTSPGRSQRTADTLAARGLLVGLGQPTRLTDVATAIATAQRALARATPTSRVVAWEGLAHEGAVGLLAPDVATLFAATFLAGLSEELVATLASFLRHHGSRLKVADELGVHRNTVRNRVEQVERTLGRSLDDPDTRAAAWLALQGRGL